MRAGSAAISSNGMLVAANNKDVCSLLKQRQRSGILSRVLSSRRKCPGSAAICARQRHAHHQAFHQAIAAPHLFGGSSRKPLEAKAIDGDLLLRWNHTTLPPHNLASAPKRPNAIFSQAVLIGVGNPQVSVILLVTVYGSEQLIKGDVASVYALKKRRLARHRAWCCRTVEQPDDHGPSAAGPPQTLQHSLLHVSDREMVG